LIDKANVWQSGRAGKGKGKGKGKVVVVPVLLTEHHAMEAYWRVDVWLHTFLTLALDGGEWSASHPGCFTPRERDPGTNWIGGWLGPRVGLDMVVKRNIPSPCWDSNCTSKIVLHVSHVALLMQVC
jgi:hypothetical protein